MKQHHILLLPLIVLTICSSFVYRGLSIQGRFAGLADASRALVQNVVIRPCMTPCDASESKSPSKTCRPELCEISCPKSGGANTLTIPGSNSAASSRRVGVHQQW